MSSVFYRLIFFVFGVFSSSVLMAASEPVAIQRAKTNIAYQNCKGPLFNYGNLYKIALNKGNVWIYYLEIMNDNCKEIHGMQCPVDQTELYMYSGYPRCRSCTGNSKQFGNQCLEKCQANNDMTEITLPDGSKKCIQPKVSIQGSNFTRALPSITGPIDQIIVVEDEGERVGNMSVSIEMIDENSDGVSFVSGSTDANGEFKFTYTPPYLKSTEVSLKATCSACKNPASKIISVNSEDFENSQMCSR